MLQNNYKQLLSSLGITLALALISFAIATVSYTHLTLPTKLEV
ncbi:hypothetical protein PVA38_11195 [Streptococcus pneumoniae D39]|nr:hypothetical protein PVA38_11195 [Streptococcus pneumoniae D39]